MTDWKKLTRRNQPLEGTRVLVCNGVNEWVTHWKPGLMSETAKFPVTHYTLVDRPYERVSQNCAESSVVTWKTKGVLT